MPGARPNHPRWPLTARIAPRLVAVFLALLVASCAKRSPTEAFVGQPEGDVQKRFGLPKSVLTLKARPGAKLLAYSDSLSFQIEDGRVKAIHRDPAASETSVQYWFHRSGAKVAIRDAVPGELTADEHLPLRVLDLRGLGQTVVYHAQSGRVLKVIEHAD